jgi:hypothetical protein
MPGVLGCAVGAPELVKDGEVQGAVEDIDQFVGRGDGRAKISRDGACRGAIGGPKLPAVYAIVGDEESAGAKVVEPGDAGAFGVSADVVDADGGEEQARLEGVAEVLI